MLNVTEISVMRKSYSPLTGYAKPLLVMLKHWTDKVPGYWILNAVRASQRCGVNYLVPWISFHAAMTRRLCETILSPWGFWERIVIAE